MEVKVESELYSPVRLFLHISFAGSLARGSGTSVPEVFAADVSTVAGINDGTWTRPDLAALAISRGEFVPFLRADLHTFEVKTAAGLDVRAAHEAHAHGRLGHFAWLVFQSVSAAERSTSRFAEVLAAANSLGVGVISFTNPGAPQEWLIDAWPSRTKVEGAAADWFVRERFDDHTKDKIKECLLGHGWRGSEHG